MKPLFKEDNAIFNELQVVIDIIKKANCDKCMEISLFDIFSYTIEKPLICDSCDRVYYCEDNDLVYGYKK